MSRGRWLTPGDPSPDAFTYRLIRLPVDADWQAPFWGALVELLKQTNWEQLSGATPEETTDILSALFQEWRMPNPLIGTIFLWTGSSAPANSLPCDGSTYLRSDYPELFDAVDAAFRPDSTHVQTPDLRGRAVLGDGTGTGLTNRAFNATGGEESHVLTGTEMPSHFHVYSSPVAIPFAYTPGPAPAGAAASAAANTTSAGGGLAHNNMQPWIALHYRIWAK